jgi:hypothetical protein
MVQQIRERLGRNPKELSADFGFCSEANLTELRRRHIRGYIATGRMKHLDTEDVRRRAQLQGPQAVRMRQRIARGRYRSRYRLRKQTVEPVFGQMKEARGLRRMQLRGLRKVKAEWALNCTAHNLTKLAKLSA